MIFTGTASIIEKVTTGYDDEGMPIQTYQSIATFDSNFQNKPSGEIKFAEYGLNEREDNKYIFCEFNTAVGLNKRIRNDKTMKVYEIVKVFDEYPDRHIEIMAKPVVGE